MGLLVQKYKARAVNLRDVILRVDGFTSTQVKVQTPVAQKYTVQILTPEALRARWVRAT